MRSNRGVAIMVGSLVLAVVAAGCGSSKGSSGGSGGSGSSGGTYKIGVLNATTGALGAVGQQEGQGMDLAVSEINAAGGIKGKMLELDKVDDQGSVNLSTAGFKRLATTDKVPLVIGPGISAAADGVAPLAQSYGVANILLISQAAVVNKTKYAFETPPPGVANAQAMVDFAKSRGAKTADLIYSNNPYGQEGLSDIKSQVGPAGMSLVGSDSWDPSKFDFTAQAAKAKSNNPAVIFLYGAGGASDGLLLKSVVASGYTGLIVGDLSFSAAPIPSAAGAAANKVVGLTAVNYGAPSTAEQKFLDAFKAKYGNPPSVLSAYAYVAVELAAAAIAKSSTFTGKDLAATIQSLNFNDGLIGTYNFTDSYHGGPQTGAFKPVSFNGTSYVPPVGS